MTFWKSQNSKTKTQGSGFQALEWMRSKVGEDGNVLIGLWCAYVTVHLSKLMALETEKS